MTTFAIRRAVPDASTFAPALAKGTGKRIGQANRKDWMRHALPGMLLALFAITAQAERADRDKPLQIEANRLTADDLKQTSQFSGNVVLNKGTMIIRSDQLTLREDADGYQFGIATVTQPDKTVYFRQKREGLDQYVEGDAARVEYDEKADNVRLLGNAVLRRFEGSSLRDELRGAVIVYDNRSETYAVSGKQPGTAGQPDGRVRLMIQPRARPAGSEPAQPGSPSAVPSVPSDTAPAKPPAARPVVPAAPAAPEPKPAAGIRKPAGE